MSTDTENTHSGNPKSFHWIPHPRKHGSRSKNHVSKSIRRKVMSVGVVFTIVRSNLLRIYFQKIINNFFPVIFRRKNLILMLISIKFRVDWYTTWPYSDNFEKNQNFMAAILKLRRGCHFEIFFSTFFFATCLIMIFDNFLRGTPIDISEKVSLCATLIIIQLVTRGPV